MTGGEQECVKKCATKFTTFTQRVASRFQELQVKMNEVSVWTPAACVRFASFHGLTLMVSDFLLMQQQQNTFGR